MKHGPFADLTVQGQMEIGLNAYQNIDKITDSS